MSIMANNNVLSFLDHVKNELERRYPGDQLIPSKFDHLVDELSTVFRADLSDLATWRPEIARRRMKFHDGYENILFLSTNL
jgi:hypothetical protein